MSKKLFIRSQGAELSQRLKEPRQFIQVLSGPRQVGKTTLVRQVAERIEIPHHFASADGPALRDGSVWLETQWETARGLTGKSKRKAALLILDEIQKIPQWSATVKKLWDEDTRNETPLKVVLLGSAPLLIMQGLTESLAGHFEILHLPHWSFPEMQAAFGWSFEEYLFYGAYPSTVSLIKRPVRWRNYVLDSIVETTISRDVLLLTSVDKPALLRQLVELGCNYSGQILSYTKMIGLLQDSGNTTTLAHYLDLLSGTGSLTGLRKYAGNAVRQHNSDPKLQVFNTALITAQSGMNLREARADHEFWGRLVESAVGAYLLNAAVGSNLKLFYWRANDFEVDFVLQKSKKLIAIEVKSGHKAASPAGLCAFSKAFNVTKRLIVGTGGIELEKFLSTPVERWME